MQRTATLIHDIRTYMNDAREICERGEYIALEGLDERVQQICASIQQLSPDEASHYAGELDEIMVALEALQRVFEEKRAALGDELNDTSKHAKAAKAYTQSDHSAPKDEA